MEEILKKLYDGMIGLAIGDALGVPVEFKTRQEIAENPVREMREYGTHHQARGVWSGRYKPDACSGGEHCKMQRYRLQGYYGKIFGMAAVWRLYGGGRGV